MKAYLSRLVDVVWSFVQVLGISLRVYGCFLRWRIQLWLRPDCLVESAHTGMKQTLLLIRHGQTAWNVEHRLPGQLPGVSLNDVGRHQAARLAEALSILPISTIISSPLERALDTAEIIVGSRNLTVQLEPDLMDTNIGGWAGQVIEELAKKDPAWNMYVKNPGVAPEGVETFPQVQQRALAAVERWRKQENIGAYPAFVAHADIVKLLVAYYTGLDATRAGLLMIDNASVSLIELEDEHQPRVVAIGWSPHPGWLKPPLPEVSKETSMTQDTGEQKT